MGEVRWRCGGCNHPPHGTVCLSGGVLIGVNVATSTEVATGAVCTCDGQPEHDVVCQHAVAADVACAGCHSGFFPESSDETEQAREWARYYEMEPEDASALYAMAEQLAIERGARASDEARLRAAEARVYSDGMTYGCDAPDWLAESILSLRAQLAKSNEVRAAQTIRLTQLGDDYAREFNRAEQAERERDEARYAARCLEHAWQHKEQPKAEALQCVRRWGQP